MTEDFTILYLEDHETTQCLMLEKLQLEFDCIFVSNNAEKAFELFIEHQPSIVITDLHMPGKDGYWLINKIREKSESIPIYVTSGFISNLTDVPGSDRTFVKPVSLPEMIGCIYQHFAEHTRLHQAADPV